MQIAQILPFSFFVATVFWPLMVCLVLVLCNHGYVPALEPAPAAFPRIIQAFAFRHLPLAHSVLRALKSECKIGLEKSQLHRGEQGESDCSLTNLLAASKTILNLALPEPQQPSTSSGLP